MFTTWYDVWKLCILRDIKSSGDETALFWVIRQRVVVISRPPKMARMGCPETSVKNYHCSLGNKKEERSSQLCLLFT